MRRSLSSVKHLRRGFLQKGGNGTIFCAICQVIEALSQTGFTKSTEK
jgi:hypothetical protein